MESPIATSWDDLLQGVGTPREWEDKRGKVKQRFLALLRMEAAPEVPADLDVRVEKEWKADAFRVKYVSYRVESDERAHAYLAIPGGAVPAGGFPAVVCLQGTTTWGARRSLGILPEPDDPQKDKPWTGLDDARNLARRGFVTVSPEHFCCASRMPAEGRFDTASFYRRHPRWTAAGKATYENSIAVTVLASQPEVNPDRIGATGFSLGGHGAIWLGAYDERVRCVVPGGAGGSFRENVNVLDWSRTKWYIYFPQLREQILAGRMPVCDWHEIRALIAPRPCLEILALNDGSFMMQEHIVTMHLKLGELYRILGAERAHAFLVHGDYHSMPDLSRAATLNWMERWLKYDGNPYGGWDSRPTALS
jgi:dienelactone hydrolase